MIKVSQLAPVSPTREYLLNIELQGLTQTFMSSGPQDHQLRGSGGPTIFLVVLTMTTLVNLETIFFTRRMCFHNINFVKPQHG